jgi:hypothetical protein
LERLQNGQRPGLVNAALLCYVYKNDLPFGVDEPFPQANLVVILKFEVCNDEEVSFIGTRCQRALFFRSDQG